MIALPCKFSTLGIHLLLYLDAEKTLSSLCKEMANWALVIFVANETSAFWSCHLKSIINHLKVSLLPQAQNNVDLSSKSGGGLCKNNPSDRCAYSQWIKEEGKLAFSGFIFSTTKCLNWCSCLRCSSANTFSCLDAVASKIPQWIEAGTSRKAVLLSCSMEEVQPHSDLLTASPYFFPLIYSWEADANKGVLIICWLPLLTFSDLLLWLCRQEPPPHITGKWQEVLLVPQRVSHTWAEPSVLPVDLTRVKYKINMTKPRFWTAPLLFLQKTLTCFFWVFSFGTGISCMASLLLAWVRALWFLCSSRESVLNLTGNSVALFQTGMARREKGGPASKSSTSPSSREWAGNVKSSFPSLHQRMPFPVHRQRAATGFCPEEYECSGGDLLDRTGRGCSLFPSPCTAFVASAGKARRFLSPFFTSSCCSQQLHNYLFSPPFVLHTKVFLRENEGDNLW